MRYYHMIIEPDAGGIDRRREYISTRQGEAPDGWRCVGVCGFHDKPREVQYPCRNCVYKAVCGDNMRTVHCDGRKTKREAGRK